jgi:hypothetical protein
MKIGKGDFVTYVTLGAVAIIETINETLKLEPHMVASLPAFLTSSLWHFAPLALLCLVGVIWMAKQFGWFGPRENPIPYTWNSAPPHIQVFGKKFINERVVLDGGIFRDCHFQNVTFVFNGTEPVEFTNNYISGSIQLSTDNPAVAATVFWLKGVGGLNETFKLNLPPGIRAESPTNVHPPA